jgi:hypothetical protein
VVEVEKTRSRHCATPVFRVLLCSGWNTLLGLKSMRRCCHKWFAMVAASFDDLLSACEHVSGEILILREISKMAETAE